MDGLVTLHLYHSSLCTVPPAHLRAPVPTVGIRAALLQIPCGPLAHSGIWGQPKWILWFMNTGVTTFLPLRKEA